MEQAVRSADGHWVIKGTQRPDGTWRKDRILRDGYTPQNEVPVYVPRAVLNSRLPKTIPGLSPGAHVPAHEPDHQPSHRAALSLTQGHSALPVVQAETTKKPPRRRGGGGKDCEGAEIDAEVSALAASVEKVELDPVKVIKKLDKKLREIEEIEKKPVDARTTEQMEKVGRKGGIAAELTELRRLHQVS